MYRINGTENHIHILSSLHPTIALSDYIREMKTATNKWIKESGCFPHFTSWAEGYCALSCTYRDKETIENYIKNQKEHHRKIYFEDEYKALLQEFEIKFDERYVF